MSRGSPTERHKEMARGAGEEGETNVGHLNLEIVPSISDCDRASAIDVQLFLILYRCVEG